jgi:pyruvate kinase
MKIEKLDKELNTILESIISNESKINLIISEIDDSYKLSAKNLCRYLILRSFDLIKYNDS